MFKVGDSVTFINDDGDYLSREYLKKMRKI